MAGENGNGFLGLPKGAWSRLDPAGIVVAILILGVPGLIFAGVDAFWAVVASCFLGFLYFLGRCLDQLIGCKRDKIALDQESLKILSRLTTTVQSKKSNKASTDLGHKKG